MKDEICVTTYSDELTQAEIDILIEALSFYYHDVLQAEGNDRKAEILLNAATKLGIYSED